MQFNAASAERLIGHEATPLIARADRRSRSRPRLCGYRSDSSLAARRSYHPTIIVKASTIRPSGNVSGTAVRNRDPPIRDFFPKNQKRFDADSIGRSATTLLSHEDLLVRVKLARDQ